MPLRHGQPLTFRPHTLCDAVDGSNGPPGGMASLANLIPDPSTRNVFVPRPAATLKIDMVPLGLLFPAFVSSELVVGDLVFGTVPGSAHPGFDQPIVYNLATGANVPVSGITASNIPAVPPINGDWTPPILAQVGGRIIVTHPGFAGGATKFGWFDVSGFIGTTTGTLTLNSAIVTGNPSVLGVQPGMTISDGGVRIPAGATVLSTTQFVLTQQGITHGNTTLDGLASTVGVAIGQGVAGLGIPVGATVAAVAAGSVTLSAATTGSSVTNVTFTGGTITMSAQATGSNVGSGLTISGGTLAAPLWGAGDTDRNTLPSVPVGVAQFNGRAYFALGTNGVVFSDSGFACRVSNTLGVQALTTSDGLAVTAIAAQQLSSPITGGVVQSIAAFQGISKIQQITGDQSFGTLTMNALPVATGTLAPLSICNTQKGLAFISPEGLRFIDFNGNVSPPVGEGGNGVTMPFINAIWPSRTCAAASGDVLRISARAFAAGGSVGVSEYWYDLTRAIWTGPHSFPASAIQPWRGSFLMVPAGGLAQLWQSDKEPSLTSVYLENGNLLTWTFQPSPLPDNEQMTMNSLAEMTLACALAPTTVMTIVAQDISAAYLDTTTVQAGGVPTNWGAFNWGQALWGGSGVAYQERSVDWNVSLVFKQLSLQFSGSSNYNVKIGNIYMKYQKLGYKLEEVA